MNESIWFWGLDKGDGIKIPHDSSFNFNSLGEFCLLTATAYDHIPDASLRPMSRHHDSKPKGPGGADRPASADAAALQADHAALQDHLAALSRERDRAYRALAMREADLARIQRIAGIGGVEVDLTDGFKSYRSPEYLSIHGLAPDTSPESHDAWLSRVHPDDCERMRKYFVDSIRGDGDDYATEYRIIRHDNGAVRWVGVRARIERDANGRATKLIGAHIDITDRKLAEESLRESEARFRAIANSAPVPMWVTNLDGTRAFVNQAYLDFFGQSPEAAVRHDWRSAIHPDDLPRVMREQDIPRVIAEHRANPGLQKPFALEMRIRAAKNEWRWVHSESLPRFDIDGRHIGFIGVGYDVTPAKLAEAELRESESASINSGAVVTRLDRTRGFINRLLEFLACFDEASHSMAQDPTRRPRAHPQRAAWRASPRQKPFAGGALPARRRQWRWLRSNRSRADPHGGHAGFRRHRQR